MVNRSEVEILMVEDNPADAELTIRSFKKNNITNKVHIVKDGAEALEFIFCTGPYGDRDICQPPKVILLDLKLPKVDGLEVLRRVKTDERTKLIPVVVLTSSKEESDLIESYKLGANSYITKPVDFDNFAKTVANLGFYWLLVNESPR